MTETDVWLLTSAILIPARSMASGVNESSMVSSVFAGPAGPGIPGIDPPPGEAAGV